MLLLRLIEKYFWCLFIGAIIIGLIGESIGQLLENYLKLFFMMVLFFTSLKIDFRKMFAYATSFFLLFYIVFIKLLVSPFIFYYFSVLLFPSYAFGMLTLGSMPSAMISGIMCDLAGGNIERAISGTIYTSLICPLTIPLVTYILAGEPIEPHVILSKIQFLSILLFVPLILAFITKRLISQTVNHYSSWYTSLSTISASVVTVGSISINRNFILQNLESVILLIPSLIIVFSFLLALGYFSVFFLSRRDKIAFAINTAFMNNGLAIVFGLTSFKDDFKPDAILPSILVEIPMAFMVIPLRFFVSRKKS